jgi:hypothetical protein
MSTRLRPAAEVIDGAPLALKGWEADKKTAPTATELEDFKRWLGISMASPTVQARIPAKLQLRGSEFLTEMSEAVREALLACIAGLEDCNARKRRDWRQTEAGHRCGHLSEPNREKIALQRETASWGQKIRWLQGLRLCVEQERARWEAALSRDGEDGPVCA